MDQTPTELLDSAESGARLTENPYRTALPVLWACNGSSLRTAGPLRKMVCTALETSIDALEATGQVAAPDLDRLHDTLYALESLTYFQGNMARVALLSSLRE